MKLPDRYNELKAMTNTALAGYFTDELPQKRLLDSMRYSLNAGGKRVRAVLTLAFCELCGGAAEDALPFACAVEMLHCYSLIHDDLPCMDDDELRRGKPTNHIVYGEACAVLAGDALQAAAFRTVLEAKASAEVRAEAARILAEAASETGICGGQILDLDAEGRELDAEELMTIHGMKTAAMIKAACLIGCVVGGADAEKLRAAESFAEDIGLAFQVRDDMLDMEGDSASLGKPAGSDEKNGKCTFATLLGLEAADRLVRERTERAKASLRAAFENEACDMLCAVADALAGRES